MARRNTKASMWRYLEVDDVFIGAVSGQAPNIINPDPQHSEYSCLKGKKFTTDDDLIEAVREITPKAYRIAIRVDDAAVIRLLDKNGVDVKALIT